MKRTRSSPAPIVVTIKKGQPVWPEWISEDEAEDIGGKKYQLIDGEWTEQKEEPGVQANNASPDPAYTAPKNESTPRKGNREKRFPFGRLKRHQKGVTR